MLIKWQQVKDFANSLTEAQLQNNVGVYVREEEEHYPINSIEICSAQEDDKLLDIISAGEAYFVIE